MGRAHRPVHERGAHDDHDAPPQAGRSAGDRDGHRRRLSDDLMEIRRRWVRLPAPTIRLRMTVLYGLVFLILGAVLLTIGYELVRLVGPGDVHRKLQQLGITPPRVFERRA